MNAVGDVDGDGDADAVDGWKSEPASARHEGDRNPPRGVPVAWSGGSRGFGHRAVSLGNGRIASTDAGGIGRISIVPLSWVEQQWGMSYLGWSETMSGVLIEAPTPANPKPKKEYSELEVISWNVYVGTPVEQVRKELTKMITRWSPDVIYLYEAMHLHSELGGLGYRVKQVRPRSTRPGLTTSNNGNIVALVRDGLQIKESKLATMTKYWKGPRLNKPQDPRSFRILKVKKQGVTWKLGGVHFPFGDVARRESVRWVKNFVKIASRLRPVVVLGDFNFNEANVKNNIADPIGAKVAGEKIDLAVYDNCELMKEDNLGKHGSDHPAWRYVFRKRRTLKKK